MNELCETCRQPLCPWEGERCEECLLNERTTVTDDIVKDLVEELGRLTAATWLSVRGRHAARHLVQELTRIRKAAEQVEQFAKKRKDDR
jgi:hypothetical protein